MKLKNLSSRTKVRDLKHSDYTRSYRSIIDALKKTTASLGQNDNTFFKRLTGVYTLIGEPK